MGSSSAPDDRWRTFIQQAFVDRSGFDRLQEVGFFFVDTVNGWNVTSQVLRSLGFEALDPVSSNFYQLIHPEDQPSYRALWERVNQGWEDTFLAEYRLRCPEGNWSWLRTEVWVLHRLADGSLGQYLGRDQDITSRKEAEAMTLERLAEAESRLLQVENLRVAGMVLSTATDLAEAVNLILEQASSLLPYSKVSLYMYRDKELKLLSSLDTEEDDKPAVEVESFPPLRRVVDQPVPRIIDDLSAGAEGWQGDTWRRYRSWMGIPLVYRRSLMGVLSYWHREPGQYRSEQIWPLMGFGESVALALHNATNLQTLQKDAQTDHLTELGTRRMLDLHGPLLLREANRHRRPLALILVDLDHFKQVNDAHGHLMGDQVLREVGSLLRSNLRSGDLVCRYGGEEFVIILPRTQAQIARQVAERLRASLASRIIPGLGQPITASFGLSILRGGVRTSLDRLVASADRAMYEAKEKGRNNVVEVVFTA